VHGIGEGWPCDGEEDVLVLYLPHKTNPIIRLARMGSHKELFQGPAR
jgi:mRNA interferase YafQ